MASPLNHSAAVELGRILQDRRVILGMSQSQVAGALGLSPAYVGLIEQAKPRGTGRPSIPTESKLLQWFDVLAMPDHERRRGMELLRPGTLSRRALLGISAALLPVLAFPDSGRMVAHSKLAPVLRTLSADEGMSGLRDWLWNNPQDISWKAGSEHRLQSQFLRDGHPAHPADIAAISRLLPGELGSQPVSPTEDEIRVSLRRSVVTAGSPASDGLARVIFGYSGSPDHYTRLPEFPIKMPYHWLLDAEHVEPAKYYIGGELVDRPNWNVATSDGVALTAPATNENGILVSDWLLVTRIRNFLDVEALNRGDFILSVAGAHGLGTMASAMLMRDAAMCREIDTRLRPGCDEFQLLIKVSADGAEPTAIELVDVQSLEHTQSDYEMARERANKHVTEVFGR